MRGYYPNQSLKHRIIKTPDYSSSAPGCLGTREENGTDGYRSNRHYQSTAKYSRNRIIRDKRLPTVRQNHKKGFGKGHTYQVSELPYLLYRESSNANVFPKFSEFTKSLELMGLRSSLDQLFLHNRISGLIQNSIPEVRTSVS